MPNDIPKTPAQGEAGKVYFHGDAAVGVENGQGRISTALNQCSIHGGFTDGSVSPNGHQQQYTIIKGLVRFQEIRVADGTVVEEKVMLLQVVQIEKGAALATGVTPEKKPDLDAMVEATAEVAVTAACVVHSEADGGAIVAPTGAHATTPSVPFMRTTPDDIATDGVALKRRGQPVAAARGPSDITHTAASFSQMDTGHREGVAFDDVTDRYAIAGARSPDHGAGYDTAEGLAAQVILDALASMAAAVLPVGPLFLPSGETGNVTGEAKSGPHRSTHALAFDHLATDDHDAHVRIAGPVDDPFAALNAAHRTAASDRSTPSSAPAAESGVMSGAGTAHMVSRTTTGEDPFAPVFIPWMMPSLASGRPTAATTTIDLETPLVADVHECLEDRGGDSQHHGSQQDESDQEPPPEDLFA